MRKQIAVAGPVALAWLGAAPALAGAVSFVSVTGDDARSCATPGTACRTFQRAHDATSPHGEIIALTPGDYSQVKITKSISITGVDGAGIFGGPSLYEITIDAGASDIVYLTGLTLDGFSTRARAVSVKSVGKVTTRKCTFVNFGAGAFYLGSGSALIEDTSVSNNNYGLYLAFSATGRALVHRFVATASISAAIFDEVPATITETSTAGSEKGLTLDGRPPVFMSRSVVTGNSAVGVDGAFTSAGDNFIRGNGTNVTGTITNIGRQ